MFNGTTLNTARCGSSPKPSCWRDRTDHHVVRIPRSPGIRFHHATRPHLRDPRCGVLPLRGIGQPPGAWPGSTTSPAPRSGTPRLQVPVTPYTSTSCLPGAPQLGHRQHDRHVGHPPAERGLSERLRLDHPHGAEPGPVKTEVAWYQIDPGTGHGSVAGTDQRPDPLVLLPFHRGQPRRRRRSACSGSSATEFVGGYYTANPPIPPGRCSRSRC